MVKFSLNSALAASYIVISCLFSLKYFKTSLDSFSLPMDYLEVYFQISKYLGIFWILFCSQCYLISLHSEKHTLYDLNLFKFVKTCSISQSKVYLDKYKYNIHILKEILRLYPHLQ